MSEFMAASAEVQMRRESEYAPIDREDADILSGDLDEIIDLQANGRSASCTQEAFNEWFESSAFLADMNYDSVAYQWPLTEQRIMLRRSLEMGDTALGENYQIIMEWAVHRDDVVEPGYSKSYVLMIPHDASEDPKLLMCQQQSVFMGLENGRELTVGTNDSSYHEVDVLLGQSFYDKLSIGTQYDAEQLLGELALFRNMLHRG